MPYITQKDKVELNPLIMTLFQKASGLLGAKPQEEIENAAWAYMRHIALRVLEYSSLNAAEQYQGKRAVRYWLIVDQNGIPVNIFQELWDRVYSKRPSRASDDPAKDMIRVSFGGYHYEDFPDKDELNPEIDALVSKIAEISGPKALTGGYDYDGAYGGMVNYSLTELMPRLLKKVRDLQNEKFKWQDVAMLIQFWCDITREIYNPRVARPYENLQAKNNGDVDVYGKMMEWLAAA